MAFFYSAPSLFRLKNEGTLKWLKIFSKQSIGYALSLKFAVLVQCSLDNMLTTHAKHRGSLQHYLPNKSLSIVSPFIESSAALRNFKTDSARDTSREDHAPFKTK